MPTLKELIPQVEKVSKTKCVFVGNLVEVPRVPTGIFELDLAIGGGVPRGYMTEIYGPEGSGKTNLALAVIREAQKQDPTAFQVFIDVEGTWNPAWAKRMGVDPERVLVARPLFAEQVADAMQKFVTADDVNVIVLDSLGAMAPEKEIEEDSDKSFYGGATKPIKRMTQKVVTELNNRRNENLPAAAIIWINQTRANFDAGPYGNPEKTTGGNSPRFAYSLRLRTSSSNIMEASISKSLPALKETTVSVKKNKIPITALQTKFKLVMLPQKDLQPGEVDSWHTIEGLLKAKGDLKQLPKGKGWALFGEEYKVLKDARAKFRSDYEFRMALQNSLIASALEKGGFVTEDEEIMDPDTGELTTPPLIGAPGT